MKQKRKPKRGASEPVVDTIDVRGARQHNLASVDLQIPTGTITTVTGPSGSGKSSLALDTLYAEGQRRYVETFSPYARQFLSRMPTPDVDEIRGIPPAIGITQRTRIISSRSTVATLTEMLDHLKVLMSRLGRLYCDGCGQEVVRDTAADVVAYGVARARTGDVLVAFPVRTADGFSPGQVVSLLTAQSIRRVVLGGEVVDVDARSVAESGDEILAVLDRIRAGSADPERMADSVDLALRFSGGRVSILVLTKKTGRVSRRGTRHFSTSLTCAHCGIEYADPRPGLFSYNSPLGACPQCRGFGKTIEIDPSLVIPDPGLTLDEPLVKPWTGKAYRRWHTRMRRFCRDQEIPLDVPWSELPETYRQAVYEGSGRWPGVRGFFRRLERKSYKMHVRVLLSRYRSHVTCQACQGGRLRPEALRFRLQGLTLPGLMALSLDELHERIRALRQEHGHDDAARLLLDRIGGRLATAREVGLGYLSLDRDSRTLSGGEVERLGLATALGGSLTRTLYVLDEPSTGLHPRDMDRLMAVVRRLRDRGNTLVIVEHDRRLIRSSDLVVDMGPGSGSDGGRVVAAGPPVALMARRDSLTGGYLSGRLEIPAPPLRRPLDRRRVLEVQGARGRNLRNIDVTIPLGTMVAVTGVSGSGKSTLVDETLHRSVGRLMGESVAEPAPHDRIEGVRMLRSLLMVDQSPVSSTPRANPATYTGVFTVLRQLWASTDLARQRGYGPGTFSFNVKGGRCERCQGSGHEKVEMQFLSDLYLPCPECDGKRFRQEVLDVRVQGLSIADALELTVDEAQDLLTTHLDAPARGLEPLRKVGLGYLRLGQPLSTLSGGEAQRVKLAGRLASVRERGGLVLLDEPTRGLHPRDVSNLIEVLDGLVQGGDTVVVVEHDMDLVKCADWVIDLGPEGGQGGGRVVAAGPPEQIVTSTGSRTAPYLALALSGGETATTVHDGERLGEGYSPAPPPSELDIRGARENNLVDVDVQIPLGSLTVVTGPSGSGKSTLVFDVLHAEGQRRYLDSLSSYARQYVGQMARPDVDRVTAVPPTVAIDQRTARGGPRSTVGTMSEVLPFLRLLFARAGVQHCPGCGTAAGAGTRDAIEAQIRKRHGGRTVNVLAPLVRSRKGVHREVARWAHQKGYARLRVDGRYVKARPWPKLDRFHEHTVEVVVGRTKVGRRGPDELTSLLDTALELGAGTLFVDPARGDGEFFSILGVCGSCGRTFPELDPRMFSFNSHLGACQVCNGTGLDHRGEGPGTCPSCGGARIRPLSRAVRVAGADLPSLTSLPVEETLDRVGSLELAPREQEIARPILAEIRSRLEMLERVGLGYLSLDRGAPTLSSGESQRVRLAAQLGSNLRGVLYILDEPTIGLHARDNERLIHILRKLVDRGNSVVVVEHDEQTVASSDLVVDLGPGAGSRGGRVVARGTPDEIARDPDSVTGAMLAHPTVHPVRGSWRTETGQELRVRRARVHNIEGVDVRIPLGQLVVVTGVSGSGKSSLVDDVIVRGIASDGIGRTCEAIDGAHRIRRVLAVDQSPIGRTPRSTPATYIGFMTALRNLFAALPESRARGWTASRFSFNSGKGRCPQCGGQGRIKVQMSFLPTMHVPCETCSERRYTAETLSVRFHGHCIADVLEMSVNEALEVLRDVPTLKKPLSILQQVGLGYLTLGQPSPTLSGGEAQRLKIASELVRPSGEDTLVVLEEPTTGLSGRDVEVLLTVLHRLVDGGSSVIVVEHNLDVVCEADTVIDMGPEGGHRGGRVVARGNPVDLARNPPPESHTARWLARMLPTRLKPPSGS